jgi:hypothetical protein
MYGAWKPPGSKKIVRQGGKITVEDALAERMVKYNPKKYRIIKRNKPDGTGISPQSK